MTDERVQEQADETRQAPADDAPEEEGLEGSGAAQDAASEVEVDLSELQAKAAERDEFLALAQRTQADFENYRRRMAREVGTAEQRGLTKAVRELLPALDNLERALTSADGTDGGGQLVEGVRLVHGELAAALARLGVERFSPRGEAFDPSLHEAMAQQPAEGAESGTVIEVYQAGYRFGETVIRPARVVVAG